MINGHGNNIYQFQDHDIEADFSSNIAFNNHSDEILAHLGSSLSSLCNYPDPMASDLAAQVATANGVTTNEVLITNGSAEAFYLVAHYLASSKSERACRTAITTPSFAEYEDSCNLYRHEISYLNLCEFNTFSIQELDSLWLGSPNNPDGYRVSLSDIFALASTNRECKIVLDRAYNELSTEVEEWGELAENVIIIESFTKLYGIPGLRLGYILAPAEVIKTLNTMRPPWSVNALSIEAGEYILSHADELHPDCETLIGESKYLQQAISQIEGFEVTPSACNFFLVRILGDQSAAELSQYLIHKHKLLIRDCANFRGLTASHFRVAAQQRGLNDKLISALQQWR